MSAQEFFRTQLNHAEVNSGMKLSSEYEVIPFDAFTLQRCVGEPGLFVMSHGAASSQGGSLLCRSGCTSWRRV